MNEPIQVSFLKGLKQDCFDVFAQALKFPDYFGRNSDAFRDCLNELACFNIPPAIEVMTSHDAFEDPHNQQIFEELLSEAMAFFAKEGHASMKVTYL
ncbi:MAG: barstar family protein [Rickettsiales bacterium]